MHLIDLITQFSVTKIITIKEKNVIIDIIFEIWLSHFFADNGGEFENEVQKELCGQFSIEFVTTAAGSPWPNGNCEQHNGLIKEMKFKLLKILGVCPQQKA